MKVVALPNCKSDYITKIQTCTWNVWRLWKCSSSYMQLHAHVDIHCTCIHGLYVDVHVWKQITASKNKQTTTKQNKNTVMYMYLWKSGLITCQDSLLFLKHGHHLILCCSFKPCSCSCTTLLHIGLSIRLATNRTGTGWRKWALMFQSSLGSFSVTYAVLWQWFAGSACALRRSCLAWPWLFSISRVWLYRLNNNIYTMYYQH